MNGETVKAGPTTWPFLPILLGVFLLSPVRLSGQEARTLSLGLSAGPGAVQMRGRDDSWDFGPFLGGRMEWGNRRSALYVTLDLQPFRAEGSGTTGEFRALYLLPSYAVGSGRQRLAFGLGMGVFDFDGGAVGDGLDFGFVTGASGSSRITGLYFVEVGWRGIQNVRGIRANVWSLQLVRRWRL